jgi:regulatory protein
LRRKLLDKGYDASVVEPVLEALRAEKLLDDRRYMESFVAYHAARGQGPLRVRAELKSHGIAGTDVEDYLSAYPDWILHLLQASKKKFGAGPPTNYADRQRRARFLGYRGYTSAQIRVALGIDMELDENHDDT